LQGIYLTLTVLLHYFVKLEITAAADFNGVLYVEGPAIVT